MFSLSINQKVGLIRVFSTGGREIGFKRAGFWLIQSSLNPSKLLSLLKKKRNSGGFAKGSNKGPVIIYGRGLEEYRFLDLLGGARWNS